MMLAIKWNELNIILHPSRSILCFSSLEWLDFHICLAKCFCRFVIICCVLFNGISCYMHRKFRINNTIIARQKITQRFMSREKISREFLSYFKFQNTNKAITKGKNIMYWFCYHQVQQTNCLLHTFCIFQTVLRTTSAVSINKLFL